MTEPLDRLMRALDYRFKEPGLLERALRHRSAGSKNNERLEFLGDAILSFVIAEQLFTQRPDAAEGTLTRLRASLVRRETLASIARELDLGASLKLGPGELKSGGRDRDSILADAFEAILGAVYLDGGLQTTRHLLLHLFETRLQAVSEAAAIKDAKTALQELLQSRALPLPEYKVTKVEGAAHEQSFTVCCFVELLASPSSGHGTSRREAEQRAAAKALSMIQQ